MSEKRQFRAIKGTRDILPPDSALWNQVEQTACEVFETYGFRDIRTPIFEETQLFDRSVGAETDIVANEMYRIESGVEIARRMLDGETRWPFVIRDSSAHTRFAVTISMFVVVSKAALESGEIASS